MTDLSGLESAVNLEELDLGSNPLPDVRVLGSLPRLRLLKLDGVVADLWPLAALQGLERLWLRDGGLVDVSPLSSLRGLHMLDLGGSRIVDPVPLAPTVCGRRVR